MKVGLRGLDCGGIVSLDSRDTEGSIVWNLFSIISSPFLSLFGLLSYKELFCFCPNISLTSYSSIPSQSHNHLEIKEFIGQKTALVILDSLEN